jgi:hypothetical protein
MTVSAQEPQKRPYDALIDPQDLVNLERALPGAAQQVLDMIQKDMDFQSRRLERWDEREHSSRLLSIWLTLVEVLGIAGLAAGVILAGYQVAGSILASVDLVALANVFVNSWRRSSRGPAPTSSGRTCSQTSVPAGP